MRKIFTLLLAVTMVACQKQSVSTPQTLGNNPNVSSFQDSVRLVITVMVPAQDSVRCMIQYIEAETGTFFYYLKGTNTYVFKYEFNPTDANGFNVEELTQTPGSTISYKLYFNGASELNQSGTQNSFYYHY